MGFTTDDFADHVRIVAGGSQLASGPMSRE
jgi:hypothetical protein